MKKVFVVANYYYESDEPDPSNFIDLGPLLTGVYPSYTSAHSAMLSGYMKDLLDVRKGASPLPGPIISDQLDNPRFRFRSGSGFLPDGSLIIQWESFAEGITFTGDIKEMEVEEC